MSALEAELKRLRAENEALKKRVADPCGTGYHIWGSDMKMSCMDGGDYTFRECAVCKQRSFISVT